ncbi:MAG: DUF86 domain-containing protein [Dehalococcoidia bacterium]|nr:DUF86 domain-containing protein [Dehalococcoidia bacterium]
MKKDPVIFLKHILESIQDVERYIGDASQDDFNNNKEKQDAVVRRLEIIGEAVRNLPEDSKQSHPEVAWHEPVAMRNILIHEYYWD